MKATLRQPRLPALDSWIEEVLADPSGEEHSAVNLIGHDPYDGSEPIVSSCLRPKAGSRYPAPGTLRPLSDTLRPLSDTLRPTGDERRPSDVAELSPLLEGDEEFDLLRFDEPA